MFSLETYKEFYIHLHADCVPVKGARRSVICDLTRNEIVFFPTDYFEVLEYLLSDTVGAVFENLGCEEEKMLLRDFISFLQAHEFIQLLKDTSLFPPIQETWDSPSIIQNAIIDVDRVFHDFENIFRQLDELGCQYVQLRSYSDLLRLEDVKSIVAACLHKSIQSVELILKYNPAIPDDAYIGLVEDLPIISSVSLHSATTERELVVNFGSDEETGRYLCRLIHIMPQQIDSHLHCGLIAEKSMNPPTVHDFFELKLFNGCLNRKLSIDSRGEIRNCPSMRASFGNIANTLLGDAIRKKGFTDHWKIRKDQIKTCRDCEFRYVCSDCRAFLEDPADVYSKPLKCGYDPYTNTWQEWSDNPLKQVGIDYYGLGSTLSANACKTA